MNILQIDVRNTSELYTEITINQDHDNYILLKREPGELSNEEAEFLVRQSYGDEFEWQKIRRRYYGDPIEEK